MLVYVCWDKVMLYYCWIGKEMCKGLKLLDVVELINDYWSRWNVVDIWLLGLDFDWLDDGLMVNEW